MLPHAEFGLFFLISAAFFTFRTIATFSHEVDFHMTFNRAGRRLDQLSDANQVLCATLIAVGARCSDHPAVIGNGGLRITDLAEATRQNVDLSPYGKAREGVYRQLVTQALEFADEKGIYRQKSAESIATLMFLEGLNREFCHPRLKLPQSRLWV